MKRIVLAAALAAMLVPVQPLAAQTVRDQVYQERRKQLLEELEEAEKRLADLRGQRVQLAARIENVIAQMMQERAQALLMSNEQNALQQLDAVLTASQDNLLAQRDRFMSLGDAVRRRSGSALVVLLRADSTETAQSIANVALTVDNVQVESRTYSAAANSALQLGAVDQLYRANILPTSHTVSLTATVNGQPLTQTVSVEAPGEAVPYVQFAVRGGQLVPTTWTSRGTTPF